MVGVRAFHVIGRSGVLSRKAVLPVRTRPSGRGRKGAERIAAAGTGGLPPAYGRMDFGVGFSEVG